MIMGKFHPESVEEIDDGFRFYAAQTFEDEEAGEFLMSLDRYIGSKIPTKTEGWSGAMTIPRQGG